jgi:hypothetical protein
MQKKFCDVFSNSFRNVMPFVSSGSGNNTRLVQWETGKVVLKIAYMTDIIVCRVCESGDLELPIDGVGNRYQ